MAFSNRRKIVLVLALCLAIFISCQYTFWRPNYKSTIFQQAPKQNAQPPRQPQQTAASAAPSSNDKFTWGSLPQRYPVPSMIALPQSNPESIPAIQHQFPEETEEARKTRTARLKAVKGNFTHAWEGYKLHAWMNDEVAPISGHASNYFGGWAATLVDSLDTLWIMELYDEFEEAVEAVNDIDFTKCSLTELNTFETTIRFLGGFLGAYDISNGKYPSLLQKAVEVAQMLYVAFDTPNRMPITRWKIQDAAKGLPQEAGSNVLVAEIGSLTLEFTRLSQLTNDPRYFDAIQRIMNAFDEQQNQTKLPGMWPIVVNAKSMNFHESSGFTLGGMADSLYEYLPKQYVLLGLQQYKKLYQDAMVAIKRNIFFRPMTKEGQYVLLPGDVSSDGKTDVSELKTEPKAQHLGCFAGGMVALGAKVFGNSGEMDTAHKLVDGCLWGYETGNMGFMPEVMHTVKCEDRDQCPWDPEKWQRAVDQVYGEGSSAGDMIEAHHLPPGVTKIDDARYILRPEAIESIFILYRITGDPSLPRQAWKMFNTITTHTTTDIAHAGLGDCTVPNPPKSDRMESFWLSETLKYFYLIFSDPDVVNLDEYVLNTEAHPFRWRP